MTGPDDNVKDFPGGAPRSQDGGESGERNSPSRNRQLFRDDRRRAVRRTIAVAALVVGVTLWVLNGVMRADYQRALQQNSPAAPTAQTLTGSTTSVASDERNEGASSELLGGVGVLLFFAVFLAFWQGPGPLAQRGTETERAVKRERKAMKRSLRRAEKRILEYRKAEGKALFAGAHAQNVTDTLNASNRR